MSQAASVEVLQRSCLDVIYIQGFFWGRFLVLVSIFHTKIFTILCRNQLIFFDFGKNVEQFACFFLGGAWLDTKGLLHDVQYQCFGLHSCCSIYIYIKSNQQYLW